MDLPESFKSPPPRDVAALEPLLALARQNYYRWPLAALVLGGLSSSVIALSLLFSSASGRHEVVGKPLYALLGVLFFGALPTWMFGWSRVRAMRRLLRHGTAWPARVISSGAQGVASELSVEFVPDGARHEVDVALAAGDATYAPDETVFVVFDPAHADLAGVITPDGVLVGRPRAVLKSG